MFDGIVSRSADVHRERVLPSRSPSWNATVGEVGLIRRSKRSNAARCSSRDHRPHLLRLAVERLVVAGRERVGAEHDPALRLVAEAVVARALVDLGQVPVAGAEAVADAVVAGEVGRGLRRGDQVVAGQPVARPSAAARTPPPRRRARGRARSRGSIGSRDARLDPLGLVQLLRDADAQALQVLALGDLDRLRAARPWSSRRGRGRRRCGRGARSRGRSSSSGRSGRGSTRRRRSRSG